MRKKNFWQTLKKGKLPRIALYSMFSSLTHDSLIFPSPWCLYHGLMTCLRTPKVTLCSSNMWKLHSASFTITHNICGSGYTLSSHVWLSVSTYVCVRAFGKRRPRVCLCCLSVAVSPYQVCGLTKARDPCQSVVDNCTWSECSWRNQERSEEAGFD